MNKLTEIPEVHEWPPSLTSLDLSNNHLSHLPFVTAPAIRTINLSSNRFSNVPLCVSSFTTLQSLNLSENRDIQLLPVEMGRLSNLTHFDLTGLCNLDDPPEPLQNNCQDCISYLKRKLHSAKKVYSMKLMLVGNTNQGKSLLAARLQEREYEDIVTVGVEVSEWSYFPDKGVKDFKFNIWDFSGCNEYYSTHQCFLSPYSLYLLLFNLKHGNKEVEELHPWLNNIALRAPGSSVIIVGTHLDEVRDEEREEVDALLQCVGQLAASYENKLHIVEVLPVGLKNQMENVSLLKEAICNHAANCKNREGEFIMGQNVPSSYVALEKQLTTLRKESREGVQEPIIHEEEFRSMVYAMNLTGTQADEEVKAATLFLTDIGSLLHYSNCQHNLRELYFIDPQWLCDLMSRIVTVKERNPYINDGILYSKDIPSLFKDKQFPWQYFEHYLTLLKRFEISFPLDDERLLIPSMLPDNRPKEFEDEKADSRKPVVYSRVIEFKSANAPPGFWSRLLFRIVHSVPRVSYTFGKSEQTLLHMDPMTECNKETEKKIERVPLTSIPTLSSDNQMSDTPRTANPLTGSQLTFTSLLSTAAHQHFNITQNPTCSRSSPNDFLSSGETQVEYWRTGLYYKDLQIMFRIESLKNSGQFEGKDGVLIIASANKEGTNMIFQLVDLVMSVIKDWFPGLQKDSNGLGGFEQKVPCFECIKLGRARPFLFNVEACLSPITKNESMIECGYFADVQAKNHKVSVADVIPDLALHDVDPKLIINPKEITYKENDASLIEVGRYGKVYRGKCRGKLVSISKYLDAYSELHAEVMQLHQLRHPCLVGIVGTCINPLKALILDEPPLKSADFLLVKKKIPVPRLTIFRIAAEVAAALRFLHSRGFIFRDLNAANVLLWSLDPGSLCHCKVVSDSITRHLSRVNLTSFQGAKGFIAPEVKLIGKRKHYSVYGHKADIFSFGMFVYQLITRKYPYHDILPHRIDEAIESGERPNLQDVEISFTGYHYLTRIMKSCWEANPMKRPDTEMIIKELCTAQTQMVTCMMPISGERSLRRAIAVTPSNFAKAGHHIRLHSELWVCCDGKEGAEVSIFNTKTMARMSRIFIKDNYVQCMALCGDHIWVSSRAGIEYGVIDIFSIESRELVHNITMHENSVCCITATDKAVYLGTLELFCFCFLNDIRTIKANTNKPVYKYVSEYAVDGIACTQQSVWVAHTRYIYFLNLDSLSLEGCIHRDRQQEAYIGQLSFDQDKNIIWSAHLGGVIFSAWDASNKCLLYDINPGTHLKRISPDTNDPNLVMTAMTPALDTVWVGMASGHIMVFHEDELLSWFHPYRSYVRFLTCITSANPCETEKTFVLSGGKDFIDTEGEVKSAENGENMSSDCSSGTLVVWEAHQGKTMKQVKLIEKHSSTYLENYDTVCEMIRQGEFTDGTFELTADNSSTPMNSDSGSSGASSVGTTAAVETRATPPLLSSDDPSPSSILPTGNTEVGANEVVQENHTAEISSQTSVQQSSIFEATSGEDNLGETTSETKVNGRSTGLLKPKIVIVPTSLNKTETFKIVLPDSDKVISIRSPRPVKLNILLSEVQTLVGRENCRLQFQKDRKTYKLQTQEHLEQYMKLPDKPHLCVPIAQASQPVLYPT